MDWFDWARGVFALTATLALIVGFAALLRRFGMIAPRPPGVGRRLSVVESLMLDPRRRLVLVRLDDKDHLLLLSAAGDSTVAIVPALAPALSQPSAPELPTPEPEQAP